MSISKQDEYAIRRIEAQLKAGYVDLVDFQDIDEIHIIRNAIKLYKEHIGFVGKE